MSNAHQKSYLPVVVPMRAVLHRTAKLRATIRTVYGPNATVRTDRFIEDDIAIEALSRLLNEGMQKCQTTDGRLDTRELAQFVLHHMKTDGGRP